MAILGTVTLAAIIGGLIGGLTAAINEDDIAAGIVSGAISSVIVTVGVATALTLGPVAGVIASAGLGFLGGFAGDIVNQWMTIGLKNVDYTHAYAVGAVTGVISLLTFGFMSYITGSTPYLFSKITDTSLSYLSRLNSSLSLNTLSFYLALTYGVIFTAVNTLLNIGINEEGEVIIDGYAGCD